MTRQKWCIVQRNLKAMGQESKNSEKSLKAEQKGGKVRKRKSLPISKKERAKVTHAINDVYHARFDGKSNCVIHNGDYTYLFENHGFDSYNIYFKMAIDEED